MTNPVLNYKISTPYKRKGELWKLGYHTGVDFKAPAGTPVVAAQAGRVLEVSQRVSWGESYGSAIVVMHKDMSRAIYAHLSKTLVQKDAQIQMGQLIGKVGNTGNSTGSHLHFEVRSGNNKDGSGYKYGDDIDPTPYLADDEVTLGLERIGKVPNAKGGKSTKANRQVAGTDSKPSV